jgi:hypothetical protein
MASTKGRSKAKATGKRSKTAPPLDPMRTGMPAQDSIVDVKEMVRGGKKFRIIKTTEIDDYEAPEVQKGKQKPHK